MNLEFLRPVYENAGPCVSLCLDTSRGSESGAEAVGLRWRHARRELSGAGADEQTLDAIEELIVDPAYTAPGRAFFASRGKIVLTEALPNPPPGHAMWGRPDPLPFLLHRPETLPHLRILVDRKGADITAIGEGRLEESVHGREWPIRKVRQGGWSEQHYQRSAEETWKENAKQVAATVQDMAAEVGAELIVIDGDVRARELLVGYLDDKTEEKAVFGSHGTRAAGGDPRLWEEEVQKLIDERLAQQRASRVDAFLRGAAVTGMDPTLDALRKGQVDVLLANAEPPGGRGLELIEAAVRTRAVFQAVPQSELALTDHVGAVLRYTG